MIQRAVNMGVLSLLAATLVCMATPAGATCGDGTLDQNEQCDDADIDNADGCSSTCTIEPGFLCAGAPSVCVPTCGNGTLEGGETCDDADTDRQRWLLLDLHHRAGLPVHRRSECLRLHVRERGPGCRRAVRRRGHRQQRWLLLDLLHRAGLRVHRRSERLSARVRGRHQAARRGVRRHEPQRRRWLLFDVLHRLGLRVLRRSECLLLRLLQPLRRRRQSPGRCSYRWPADVALPLRIQGRGPDHGCGRTELRSLRRFPDRAVHRGPTDTLKVESSVSGSRSGPMPRTIGDWTDASAATGSRHPSAAWPAPRRRRSAPPRRRAGRRFFPTARAARGWRGPRRLGTRRRRDTGAGAARRSRRRSRPWRGRSRRRTGPRRCDGRLRHAAAASAPRDRR